MSLVGHHVFYMKGDFMSKVKIHDVEAGTSHVYYSEEDCPTKTDLSIYRTVLQFNDVITMGKFIGEPL